MTKEKSKWWLSKWDEIGISYVNLGSRMPGKSGKSVELHADGVVCYYKDSGTTYNRCPDLFSNGIAIKQYADTSGVAVERLIDELD